MTLGHLRFTLRSPLIIITKIPYILQLGCEPWVIDFCYFFSIYVLFGTEYGGVIYFLIGPCLGCLLDILCHNFVFFEKNCQKLIDYRPNFWTKARCILKNPAVTGMVYFQTQILPGFVRSSNIIINKPQNIGKKSLTSEPYHFLILCFKNKKLFLSQKCVVWITKKFLL